MNYSVINITKFETKEWSGTIEEAYTIVKWTKSTAIIKSAFHAICQYEYETYLAIMDKFHGDDRDVSDNVIIKLLPCDIQTAGKFISKYTTSYEWFHLSDEESKSIATNTLLLFENGMYIGHLYMRDDIIYGYRLSIYRQITIFLNGFRENPGLYLMKSVKVHLAARMIKRISVPDNATRKLVKEWDKGLPPSMLVKTFTYHPEQ